jgi:hypothetical protein
MSAAAYIVSNRYFGLQNTVKKTLTFFDVTNPEISSVTLDKFKVSAGGVHLDINFNSLELSYTTHKHSFDVITIPTADMPAMESEYTIVPPVLYNELKPMAGTAVVVFRFPVEKSTRLKQDSREAKRLITSLVDMRRRSGGSAARALFEMERNAPSFNRILRYIMMDEFEEAAFRNGRSGLFNFNENLEADTEAAPAANAEAAAGAGAGAGAAPAPAVAPVSAEEASRLAAAVDMRRFIGEGRLDNKRDRLLLLQVLGLQKLKANPGEIRKAYRDLSLLHHPDKGGNAEKFKNVDEAYSRLTGKGGGRKTRKSAYRHRRRTYKH